MQHVRGHTLESATRKTPNGKGVKEVAARAAGNVHASEEKHEESARASGSTQGFVLRVGLRPRQSRRADGRLRRIKERYAALAKFSRFSTSRRRSSSEPRRLRITASLLLFREAVEGFEKFGFNVANGFIQVLEAVCISDRSISWRSF